MGCCGAQEHPERAEFSIPEFSIWVMLVLGLEECIGSILAKNKGKEKEPTACGQDHKNESREKRKHLEKGSGSL